MRYVVHYRPESKPQQEASHLERTLHPDMVCRHRNQLIDRTKNVYCLKNSNNKGKISKFMRSILFTNHSMLTATWYRSSFFCYTITNHQFHKEISNTPLLQRCALRKFHVTNGQNTRDQITCNRRSKLA